MIVIGGLIYITRIALCMTALNSFLTTLGILILLLVGDQAAQLMDKKKLQKKNKKRSIKEEV